MFKDLLFEYNYLLGELERYDKMYYSACQCENIGQINYASSMIESIYSQILKVKEKIDFKKGK